MHSKLPLKSLSEMSNIRRMVLHPNIMRPLGQSFTLFEHKAFEKNAVLRDYILKSKGPNVTGTILNYYFMLQDQSTHTYHSQLVINTPWESRKKWSHPHPSQRLLITPSPTFRVKIKKSIFPREKNQALIHFLSSFVFLSLLWVTERGDVVLFCWDWPVCHCHPAMDAETLIGKLPQPPSVLNAVSVWSLTLLDIV